MARFPRIRFGLRLMLITVALLSVWLAYQAHWLGERREALAWIQQHEVGDWSQADLADVTVSKPGGGVSPDKPRFVPIAVLLFAAPRVHYITLDKSKLSGADISMLDQLQALFPEADGVHVHEPEWSHRWPPADREGFFAGP